MPRSRIYTDEQLRASVGNCVSYAELARTLGIRPAGGNYATLKARIRQLGLSTTHFKGQACLRGKTHHIYNPQKRPLEAILNDNTAYNSNRLRKRLIAAGYLEHRCSSCNHSEWFGRPIPIELDHINGNIFDNRLENLRLLCPNCHALTHNYRGKNKQKQKDMELRPPEQAI
jgi:hypothetical protein